MNFAELTSILPLLAVVSTAIFVLLLSVVFRPGGNAGGAAPARWSAVLALIGLFISGMMFYAKWCSFPGGKSLDTMFGMLYLDPFAIFVSLVLLDCAALAVLISVKFAERLENLAVEYFALIVLAVFGMIVMVSTTHLVTLLVGLETMSLAVYVLVGFLRRNSRANEAALKYFLMGAFASGFLVYGIAFLYGTTGSADFRDIASVIESGYYLVEGGSTLALLGTAFVLIGFAFKVAAVPFHMWTPDTYEGAPLPVTAFMAAAVKVAAFATLSRLLVVAFWPLHASWMPILWALAVASMIVGNLAAIFQGSVKRMLAYSSIAHAGYMLAALASLGGGASRDGALASVLFYLCVYILMNVGAFAVMIYLTGKSEQEKDSLGDFRGVGYRYPLAGAAMTIFMLALAGVPPTAGFMGKFYILNSVVDSGMIGLAVIIVLNSAASAFYYLRVVVQMYMHDEEEVLPAIPFSLSISLVLAVCAVGVLYAGVSPSFILDWVTRAVQLII